MTKKDDKQEDIKAGRGSADNQDSSLRRAGVERTDGKVDETTSANQKQEELTRNPPPLVHVDPSTGKPIDQPLSPSKEPNRLTQPGAGNATAGNREK